MQDHHPIISVIIPCFNHGKYINEAIESIKLDESNYSIEIIIVDDGSTDLNTIQKLEVLQNKGFTVIKQENGGPAKARNTGITIAKGKYILPIDADNKIKIDYINKSIPFLEANDYDIVYAKPIFWNEEKEVKKKFKVRPFDELSFVTGNFADACAIYRKSVWEKNNGYDEKIPYHGFEDWEFWVNAASNGFKFKFIDEYLFYYRVLENSVISTYNEEKSVINHRYIAKKHSDLFLEKLVKLNYVREKHEIDILRFPLVPFIYIFYLLGFAKKPSIKAREKFTLYRSLKNKIQND
ncbi:MAG: glycosyltransferase family 2 protein [Chitinophagaceae bacterium]|uniref:glycosyltransferase family 2 protein n=1 Tax=Sediminibacterium sp. TEGAF015 TaxID=575378 RepID=UPI001BBE611F|nr:glycosyltransferase family A protein [Sediminibacterium sp. TEGAF015]MBS4063804.1 glycosyltransferase family 2 protein [Chitinophagaceae bacterium]BDQ12538.1 glycosyl transferase [Sediminibacterium sp. TEGAF015]